MAPRSYVLTLSCVAGVVILASGCGIQISNGYVFDYQGETSQKKENGTIDATVKAIEVKNKFGDVDVAKSESESNWTWTGKTWATDKSDADAFVLQLKMNVAQDGDKQIWTIVLPERGQKLRGVKSNLTIRVPAEVSVVVDNKHGAVLARGHSGSTKIDNEHGSVEATALTGDSKIKNQHGPIVVHDLSGEADVNCEHGNIKIHESSTEKLSVKCEHGNVNIENATGRNITTATEHGATTIQGFVQNIKCRAEHGDVNIALDDTEFHSIIANTEHADVEISLPSSVEPRVDLSVDHGKTKSDFPSIERDNAPLIKVRAEHGNIKIRAE